MLGDRVVFSSKSCLILGVGCHHESHVGCSLYTNTIDVYIGKEEEKSLFNYFGLYMFWSSRGISWFFFLWGHMRYFLYIIFFLCFVFGLLLALCRRYEGGRVWRSWFGFFRADEALTLLQKKTHLRWVELPWKVHHGIFTVYFIYRKLGSFLGRCRSCCCCRRRPLLLVVAVLLHHLFELCQRQFPVLSKRHKKRVSHCKVPCYLIWRVILCSRDFRPFWRRPHRPGSKNKIFLKRKSCSSILPTSHLCLCEVLWHLQHLLLCDVPVPVPVHGVEGSLCLGGGAGVGRGGGGGRARVVLALFPSEDAVLSKVNTMRLVFRSPHGFSLSRLMSFLNCLEYLVFSAL